MCINKSIETAIKVIGCLEVIITIAVMVFCTYALLLTQNKLFYPNLNRDELQLISSVFLIRLIFCFYQLIFNVILLWGIFKKNMSMVVTWLVFVIYEMVMTQISLIVSSIISTNLHSPTEMLFKITADAVFIVFKMYFFVLVYSYWRHAANPSYVDPESLTDSEG